MRRKPKVILMVLGAAVGGLMVASNSLVYGYELPWLGIAFGVVIGGGAGYWAGRCFFSTEEKPPPPRDIIAELREEGR